MLQIAEETKGWLPISSERISGAVIPETRMHEVLQCLKKYGQRLDLEIAEEMRLALTTVRKRLAELSATRLGGDVPADALRGRQDDRGVAVPRVRVRPRAGAGAHADGGGVAAEGGRGKSRAEEDGMKKQPGVRASEAMAFLVQVPLDTNSLATGRLAAAITQGPLPSPALRSGSGRLFRWARRPPPST